MSENTGITNNTLFAIIALETIVLGIVIALKTGFSFVPLSDLSYLGTFGGTRHILGTLAALILIPILTKQTKKGYFATIIILSITLCGTLISVIDLMFLIPGYETKALVPMVMLIPQIVGVFFCFRAIKETEEIQK